MGAWVQRRDVDPRARSQDELIDRRALEIMERLRCDWIEAGVAR